MKEHRKLQKNSTASKIVEVVENGEQLTVDDFAKRFGTREHNVQTSLVKLRKRGYCYHPTGGDHQNKGVIVDITTDIDFFVETKNCYHKQINSRIKTHFRNIEGAWMKFPRLRTEIQQSVKDMLSMMLNEDKKLLNANPRNINPKDKTR